MSRSILDRGPALLCARWRTVQWHRRAPRPPVARQAVVPNVGSQTPARMRRGQSPTAIASNEGTVTVITAPAGRRHVGLRLGHGNGVIDDDADRFACFPCFGKGPVRKRPRTCSISRASTWESSRLTCLEF